MTTEPVLPRVRPEIAALPPYKQGKPAAPDGFKLSSNENPFEPLPGVVEAVRGSVALNRYPDASAGRLRQALGERYGVEADEVIVGAGSVALIAAFIQAAAGHGDEVVYPWRSFEAYPGLVMVAGASSVQVPNLVDGRHDLGAMAAAITDKTRIVIVCTPNNPTGPIVTSAEFADFVDKVPSDVLILLDEAYTEFVTDDGAVDGLAERVHESRPNIVVLRTFSKAYGLAALRVGYAIGHRRVLDAARATQIPLSVTAQAEEAALASLAYEPELRARVAEIAVRREALVAGLREAGWPVPDAQSNFVWVPTTSPSLAEALEEADIMARPFPDGVRISVGEADSIARILEVARTVAPE